MCVSSIAWISHYQNPTTDDLSQVYSTVDRGLGIFGIYIYFIFSKLTKALTIVYVPFYASWLFRSIAPQICFVFYRVHLLYNFFEVSFRTEILSSSESRRCSLTPLNLASRPTYFFLSWDSCSILITFASIKLKSNTVSTSLYRSFFFQILGRILP